MAWRIPLLGVCFLVSGACGLIYEVVWTKTFSMVFGCELHSIATVVAAFMGGLAAGGYAGGRWADRLRNPARAYAFLEIGIAVWCVSVPHLLALAEPLWHALYGGGPFLFSLGRLGISLLLLVPPAILMGATFPFLVRAGTDSAEGIERISGFFYALNTLGAAAGALLAGFFLIPAYGYATTTLLAAGGNVLAGVGALAVSSGIDVEPSVPSGTASAGGRGVLVAVGLSGLAAMIFQVSWTRIVGVSFGATVYAFSLIVAVFILGLAAGSAAAGRIAGRWEATRSLVVVLVFAAAAGLGSMLGMHRLPRWNFYLAMEFGDVFGPLSAAQGVVVALLTIGPTLMFGAAIPLACRARAGSSERVGDAIGRVYAANTVGAIAGTLLAGFVLVPLGGFDFPQKVAALALTAGAMVVLSSGWSSFPGGFRTAAAAAVAVLPLVAPSLPEFPVRDLCAGEVFRVQHVLQPDGTFRREGGVGETFDPFVVPPVFHRFDSTGIVSVHREGGNRFLRINGRTNASVPGDLRAQTLVAHLPLLHHPSPRRVLLVGLGAGITLGSVLSYPVERCDCVELSPGVVEAAGWFAEENGRALEDPRARVLVQDARSHARFSGEKYDVIISEPSNLWVAGMVNLYTREFLDALRSRLLPGGIVGVWIQGYRLSPEDLRSLVRTFLDVFSEASLWEIEKGVDYVVLGAASALQVPARQFEKWLGDERIARNLARIGLRDPSMLAFHFVCGREALDAWCRDAEMVTDDRCQTEHSAPRSLFLNYRIRIIEEIHALRGPLTGIVDFPPGWQKALRAGDLHAKDWAARGMAEQMRLAFAAWDLLDYRPLEERADALCDYALREARRLLRRGKVAEARELLTLVPRRARQYAAAQVELYSIRARSSPREAEEEARRAVRERPGESVAPYRFLGGLLVDSGRPEQAAELLEEAIRLFPKDADCYYHLARAYVALGRKGEAVSLLEHVLTFAPRQVEIRWLLRTIQGEK